MTAHRLSQVSKRQEVRILEHITNNFRSYVTFSLLQISSSIIWFQISKDD